MKKVRFQTKSGLLKIKKICDLLRPLKIKIISDKMCTDN